MKYLSCLFLIYFSLLACKKESKSDHQAEEKPVSHALPFAGDYIHTQYIEALKQSWSPRTSQELIEEVFIHIPSTTAERTTMVYGFHEVGPMLEFVKHDDVYEVWEVQGDTLHEKLYEVIIVDSLHVRLGDDVFRRTDITTLDQQPLVAEGLLFAGQYMLEKKPVTFLPNGEVTGLDGYTKYKVLTDYLDAGLQVDQVGLGHHRDSLTYFAFKMNADQLQLFELRCLTRDESDDRCVEVDFGKLKYRFHRQ